MRLFNFSDISCIESIHAPCFFLRAASPTPNLVALQLFLHKVLGKAAICTVFACFC